MGGISLGGGAGFPGGMGPSGAPHPGGPLQVPANAGGILNAIQGSLGGGGSQQQRPPQQSGTRPYEAPEAHPGAGGQSNWNQAPPMQAPPLPPMASLLPPPPQMGGNTQPPPPAFTPVQPVTGTGTQFNGNAYQPQAGASGDRTPPGTVYRWGPNGYGYYPV
jgi:hypothetical protein